MALLTVQLFGTKKCPHTRAAERFFKERSVTVHAVDLANKGMSPVSCAMSRRAPAAWRR